MKYVRNLEYHIMRKMARIRKTMNAYRLLVGKPNIKYLHESQKRR